MVYDRANNPRCMSLSQKEEWGLQSATAHGLLSPSPAFWGVLWAHECDWGIRQARQQHCQWVSVTFSGVEFGRVTGTIIIRKLEIVHFEICILF